MGTESKSETEVLLCKAKEDYEEKKFVAKYENAKVNIMKTITICGSMKYEKEMHEIAFKLETKHDYNVLQCVYNLEKKELTPLDLDALKKAHYKKIDISDGIYVVDIQGYIGRSVREEIQYAKKNGKEIIIHSSYNL